VPGKDPIALPTGAPIMNLRDVPHAGWKVAGETTIKLFTVHIVDKGKPLYDAAKYRKNAPSVQLMCSMLTVAHWSDASGRLLHNHKRSEVDSMETFKCTFPH
jgi:hypothetical protein